MAASLVVLASGAGADPLYTGNHAPFAGLLGFPALRDAAVLPRGAFRAELHSSLANSHSTSARAGEAVNLDGETLSLVARTAYGLGAGWDIEAEVSWTRHSPGVLDRWIDDWHDVWGLPEGDRPGAPRDLIDFAYRGPEGRFALRDTTAGIGRLHLAVTRTLWQGRGHALSARAGAKLGVGKAADLLGGGDDAYVSGHWTRAGRGARSLTWHAQAGLLRAGASPVLPGIAERSPWFAGVGVEWPAWRRLHLKLQLDTHAPFADSALKELGEPSMLLTVAGAGSLATRWEVEFGFTEDIAPRTAPDFTPRFGVRYRPARR